MFKRFICMSSVVLTALSTVQYRRVKRDPVLSEGIAIMATPL